MIVVDHDGEVFVFVTQPDCWKNDPAYYAGLLPPNYPVPAIREPDDCGPTWCKGLLGECMGKCKWPDCP